MIFEAEVILEIAPGGFKFLHIGQSNKCWQTNHFYAVKEKLPAGIMTTWEKLPGHLKHVLQHPLTDLGQCMHACVDYRKYI